MLNMALSPIFFLVFGFVLTIVLQAWFVRRLSYLRGKTKESKGHCDRLREEAGSLAEAVTEFKRGLESNTTSVQMLEREIEDLREKIAAFTGESGEGEPPGPAAAARSDEGRGEEATVNPAIAPSDDEGPGEKEKATTLSTEQADDEPAEE